MHLQLYESILALKKYGVLLRNLVSALGSRGAGTWMRSEGSHCVFFVPVSRVEKVYCRRLRE